MLEWIDFALGGLTFAVAYIHSRRERQNAAFVLGLAVFGAALLDLLYGSRAQQLSAAGPPEIVSIFRAACRTGAATSLTVGLGLLLLHRRRPKARALLLPMGLGAILLLALVSVSLLPALLTRLSRLWPGLPLDTLPLAAWILTGGLLHQVIGRNPADVFAQAVVLSSLPQAGSHLFLALGQGGPPAQLLKLFAYLLPAAGVALLGSRRAPVPAAPDKRSPEEQLRSKEIQLRQLTENIREIFWMTAPDQSEVHYVSPAYESIFGRSCESLYQDPRSFLEAIHPADRQRIEQALPRRARGDFEYEYRIIRPDGSMRWIWSRAFPVRNDEGKIYRIAGISEDITARRRAADERETIRLISEFLLTSPPLDSLFREVARLVSGRFDFPLVAIVLHDEATSSMVFAGWAGAQFLEPLRVPVEATIAGSVLRTGKAFMVEDVSRYANLHPVLRQLPGNFVCCFPMKLGERVLGALSLAAEQERKLEAETIENLQLIANHIAQAIDRKQADDALRRSEARNRALVEALPDQIYRLDQNGILLDYSGPDELGGRSRTELLGSHVSEALPSLAGEALRAVQRALGTGKMQYFEYAQADPSGRRDFEARVVPIGEDEALIIVRDITERKRLEREILEVSGREQRRIGQDLHDGLCQQLSGVALLSRALENSLAAKSMPEKQSAAHITALINQSVEQARSLARGLYPVELEGNGIVAALRELAGQVESFFSIRCLFRYDAPVEIADGVAALHLYRIAQEAVGNAAKHAKPRQIVIKLAQDRGAVRLTVSDDGKGLPREPGPSRGMGLSIMRYRARLIDATLDIQPQQEGGGTLVTCTLRKPNSTI